MMLASTEVLEGGVFFGSATGCKTADARRRTPVVAGLRQSTAATHRVGERTNNRTPRHCDATVSSPFMFG